MYQYRKPETNQKPLQEAEPEQIYVHVTKRSKPLKSKRDVSGMAYADVQTYIIKPLYSDDKKYMRKYEDLTKHYTRRYTKYYKPYTKSFKKYGKDNKRVKKYEDRYQKMNSRYNKDYGYLTKKYTKK